MPGMDGCKSRYRQEMRRLMDSVPLTNEMMDQPPRNFYLNLHLRGWRGWTCSCFFFTPDESGKECHHGSKDSRSVR